MQLSTAQNKTLLKVHQLIVQQIMIKHQNTFLSEIFCSIIIELTHLFFLNFILITVYHDRLTLHWNTSWFCCFNTICTFTCYYWESSRCYGAVSQVNTRSICTLLTQLYRTQRASDTLNTYCEPVLAVIWLWIVFVIVQGWSYLMRGASNILAGGFVC